MSRVGLKPIKVPSGVKVDISGDIVNITGAKGNLTLKNLPGIKINSGADEINISRVNDERINKARHGLMRSLVNNMVEGVSQGFSKQLEINGVGYRANLSGKTLTLSVGLSHDVKYTVPDDIEVTIQQNIITVSGIDKQKVGQTAAEIRSIKKPEPYKGKGIKYLGEKIIRKSGKSGKEK